MSTKREDTRLRLLYEARRLLVSRGFHGVGLDDIAAAAGVSRQAVYKSHFSSKTELLVAIGQYVHETERLDELIRPVAEAKTALEALDCIIVATVQIEERVHRDSMVLSAASLSDAGAKAAWTDRMATKYGFLRAVVLRLRKERRLSAAWSVAEASDLLAMLTSTGAYQVLVVEQGWSQAAFIRRVRDVYGTVLVVPSTKKPRRSGGR